MIAITVKSTGGWVTANDALIVNVISLLYTIKIALVKNPLTMFSFFNTASIVNSNGIVISILASTFIILIASRSFIIAFTKKNLLGSSIKNASAIDGATLSKYFVVPSIVNVFVFISAINALQLNILLRLFTCRFDSGN